MSACSIHIGGDAARMARSIIDYAASFEDELLRT
jgi:hypothetical protein